MNVNITPEVFEVTGQNSAAEIFLIKAISKNSNFNFKNPYEIIFVVNGVQLSFTDVVVEWQKSYSEHMTEFVEERAKDLVKSRLTDELENLEKTIKKLKETSEDILRDAGFKNVTDDPEYWYE